MKNVVSFKNSEAEISHLEERINAEFKFAEKLCGFHKENADVWQGLIRKADKTVSDAASTGDLEKITLAVTEAEKILEPVAKFAKNYSIYCVGHAHIDMNWMWPWQDTVATTIDTFGTVLKLMKEFPGFKFSQSQASVYAILEKYNPELLAQIARRVKEGRWEVTASHWVEGDKNLSGDESLCRHLLYTRRYMKKLFGLKPGDVEIDWAPDTFGHAATIPSYLVKGGVKYVYLHRPGELGPKRPLAFWWKAPDGAKVLVRNDSGQGYNGSVNPGIIDPLCNFFAETGLPYVMFVYGVGDHGGGPTRRDLMRAIDMDSWPVFPKIVFSTSREFYKRLEKDASWLPILECELNFELAGCYTTQTLIKKCNRFSENRLNDAENVAALLSRISGFKYNAAGFEECWRDTLFSQFHDILPGSGVHDTRTYTHGLFQKTMASVLSEKTKALRQFASKIDTTFAGLPEEPDVPSSRVPAAMGAGVGFLATQLQVTHAEQSVGYGPRPFLIFNTQGYARNEIAEVTIWDNTSGRGHAEFAKLPFLAVAPNKATIKPQLITSGAYWGHNYVKLAFSVEIPGNGYAVYTIVEKEIDKKVEDKVWQLGRKHTCWYSKVER
ncbi:MAG: alpha-mannosidase, partial [Victivallales bacterium]